MALALPWVLTVTGLAVVVPPGLAALDIDAVAARVRVPGHGD